MSLYQAQHKRLADGWICPGQSPPVIMNAPGLPKGVSPTDAAAWTVVARVLAELDETLSKG